MQNRGLARRGLLGLVVLCALHVECTRGPSDAPLAAFPAAQKMLAEGTALDASGSVTARRGRIAARITRNGTVDGALRVESRGVATSVQRMATSANVERFVFARGEEIEELALLAEPSSLDYRVELPDGYRLRALSPTLVEIDDRAGDAWLRMRADRAWSADGREVRVALAIDGDVVRVVVPDDATFPLAVDPTWAAGTSPTKPRAGHTATLLGDGRVLIAGGAGGASDTAEIFDARTGQFIALEPKTKMTAQRTGHTATMLANGKVLIVGGAATASAEIFDPRAMTFTATGSPVIARAHHSAARLANGKVLIKGDEKGGVVTTELYDPATGTFKETNPGSVPGSGSMTLLEDGRVLFVGQTSAAIYDATTANWTNVPTGIAFTMRPRSAARLHDGRVAVTSSTNCPGSTGGPTNCITSVQIFDPTTGMFGAASADLPGPSGGSSATVLPDGKVLLTGGFYSTTTSQVFDPSTQTATLDASFMLVPHSSQTATTLPGGDVLVLGGEQLAADLRPWLGSTTATAGSMTAPRLEHMAQRLKSGEVLIAGGFTFTPPNPVATHASADLFDPKTGQFTATGSMTTPRDTAAIAMLPSGKVLVVGGHDIVSTAAKASAEVYDPTTKQFTAVGPMTTPRVNHAIARLPDGKILVAGGCIDTSNCPTTTTNPALATAEIFDPVTETFQGTGAMQLPRAFFGMTPLPNGLVLVAGGLLNGTRNAEIFDPKTGTFRTTGNPSNIRDGRTLQLLASGRAFLGGNDEALPNESFDPVTETWSQIPGIDFAPQNAQWRQTPDGHQLLLVGATKAQGSEYRVALLDLLASQQSSFLVANPSPTGPRHSVATSLVDRGLLVTGGSSGGGGVLGDVTAGAWIHSDGTNAPVRPDLTSAPAQVAGGAPTTITGTHFTSADGDPPLAFWVSSATGSVVPSRITDFTATSATWLPPATTLHGPGWLSIFASGLPSSSLYVEITAGQAGAECRFDAECGSGFCTEGVCCDARCDGICFSCTARRKGAGTDGSCGVVTPGKDPDARCVLGPGAPCSEKEQCGSGHCAQGVCCEAECSGTCQSCALPDSVGSCKAIVPCTTCRDSDCAPFKCDVSGQCRTQCGSAADCVDPAVCSFEGQCLPPPIVRPADESLFGCAATRRPVGSFAVIGVVLAALGGALARRGRRR